MPGDFGRAAKVLGHAESVHNSAGLALLFGLVQASASTQALGLRGDRPALSHVAGRATRPPRPQPMPDPHVL